VASPLSLSLSLSVRNDPFKQFFFASPLSPGEASAKGEEKKEREREEKKSEREIERKKERKRERERESITLA